MPCCSLICPKLWVSIRLFDSRSQFSPRPWWKTCVIDFLFRLWPAEQLTADSNDLISLRSDRSPIPALKTDKIVMPVCVNCCVRHSVRTSRLCHIPGTCRDRILTWNEERNNCTRCLFMRQHQCRNVMSQLPFREDIILRKHSENLRPVFHLNPEWYRSLCDHTCILSWNLPSTPSFSIFPAVLLTPALSVVFEPVRPSLHPYCITVCRLTSHSSDMWNFSLPRPGGTMLPLPVYSAVFFPLLPSLSLTHSFSLWYYSESASVEPWFVVCGQARCMGRW